MIVYLKNGKGLLYEDQCRGYWENNSTEGHGVDAGLMRGLVDFFMRNGVVVNNDFEYTKIIDIGCGDGSYTKYLKDAGFDCVGYDGNPYTVQLTNGLCKVADFSIKQDLGKFNWVLSLEVAEHIPAEFEDVFIDNLHRHNTEGIILSWALPSHGGDGHVNPKENDYVIEINYRIRLYTR